MLMILFKTAETNLTDTPEKIEVFAYDLYDLVCDAYVAQLDDTPLPVAFYLERIKNTAYGYLSSEMHQQFEEYLNNKDYLPKTKIITDLT